MAKNILICDDAAFMRMMLKDILVKEGYEVIGEAANGAQGVEKYNELNVKLFNGKLGGCDFGVFKTGKGASGRTLGYFKITGKTDENFSKAGYNADRKYKLSIRKSLKKNNIFKLAYLCDMFNMLNELKLSLQWRMATDNCVQVHR